MNLTLIRNNSTHLAATAHHTPGVQHASRVFNGHDAVLQGRRWLPWRCSLRTSRLRGLAIRLCRVQEPEGPLWIILCE